MCDEPPNAQRLRAECDEIKTRYFLRDEITREEYIRLIDAWMVKARAAGLSRRTYHHLPRKRRITALRRKWWANKPRILPMSVRADREGR